MLAIGAHADDIEIGCGGTVLRLVEANRELELVWVVLCGQVPERAEEARASAEWFLSDAGASRAIVADFRDGFLPHSGPVVKEFFETLKGEVAPDLILTHQRRDLHQDHRAANELTWNTWRDHLVLEYEVPKYDGDVGQPNVYVELSEEILARKIEGLMRHFASQRSKRWFTEDLFRGIARLRGMESNAASLHAEAFYGRKLVL